MGWRTRALLPATTVATAVALLAPVSPAGATTTVTAKGGVVTINVDVDLIGGRGQKGPDGQPLRKYWEQIIKDAWGQAFDQLPYRNCLKFELDLELNARGRNASARDGRHTIFVTAETPGGWEKAGWEGAPETSRNPRTSDGTRSFEHERDGSIPVNAPPTVVAHEFGHVLGLGDDRQNGQVKPGRDGTLMVGGAEGVDPNQPLRIDQDLIDRIGDAIRKHLDNQGKELPKCESWTGTLRTDVDPCRELGYPLVNEGAVEVVVNPSGSATGSGTITPTEVGGPPDPAVCYTAIAPGSYQLPVEISGNRNRQRFRVTVFGTPLDLKIAGKTAEGTGNLGGTTVTMNLRCTKGCDERGA